MALFYEVTDNSGKVLLHINITVNHIHVVVNFLSQVIVIFPLFQLHQHTLPYPKI